jgi:SAM-dependent methyltransferase
VEHFYQSIDGWFNFKDIYDAAIREAREGAVFVELGSWYGRSAAYLAVEIANSGKRIDFYCVDTWKGSVDLPWWSAHVASAGGSILPFFRENMQRGGVWHLIRPLEMPSSAAAGYFAAGSIDFIMIDGSHDYASVREDVRLWLPKLKPNGLIAGDDAGWPGVLIGVHETIPQTEIQLANHGANWSWRKQRPERGFWAARRFIPTEIDCLTYIPYVNRPELLDRAIMSIPDLWPTLVVVDQSRDGLPPENHPWIDMIAGVFRTPYRAMSFTQMMNWAQAEAFERRTEYLAFMHNDAECVDGVAAQVLDFASRQATSGVVFTHYDAFAVFRVEAVLEAGPWDETFQWYFSDNDYYHRMKLRGWEQGNFGGQKVIHHTSQTVQSDQLINREVKANFRWHHDHYCHKWGGPPGAERYSIPYDGNP